ncbi:MAG: preprotein translocase subunit SecG [Clostridia bacterium]|nr:preprotein translocase subunit SecG [Clostridia bacterium]MBQ7107963.1 preprotein translocase subunit SecG [Clostridia bacterium]
MGVLEIVVGAIILLLSVVVIFVVILQEGHRAGINGAISGGADTFLSKNKARTVDAFLARWTKWFAIAFFVLAIVANFIALNK